MWQLVGSICGWYLTSVALSLYNKWMFDAHKGLSVPYPLLVTALHQAFLWLFCYLHLRFRGQKTVGLRKETDWNYYFKYVVSTAVFSAGDIGLSNVSLKFVPLTVYTIVKSCTVAFVLLFGCLFRLERFDFRLLIVVIIMFLGASMMMYRPDKGNYEYSSHEQALGVVLVLGASCLGGLRWVYTQLILKQSAQESAEVTKTEASFPEPHSESLVGTSEDANMYVPQLKKTPIFTIYQLAPIVGCVLVFTSMVVEQPFDIAETALCKWEGHSTFAALVRGFFMLFFPSLAVFLMTICEFAILQISSVLTLSIAGICKEILTIIMGLLVLKEVLDFYNWIGMTITLVGACYYNYYRYTQTDRSSTHTVSSKRYEPLKKSDAKSDHTMLEMHPEWEWELTEMPETPSHPSTSFLHKNTA